MAKKGKPASVSLKQAISELEREVSHVVELESDPMLRAILAGRIDLTIAELAHSIKDNRLEGKVFYDSNGAPDPARSTITANELTRFRNWIRRSLKKTKMSYLAQHNVKSSIEGEQAGFDLGYWSAIARDHGPVNDWNYWIQLSHLTPREAACLLYGLDPNEYDTVASNNYPTPAALVERIDDIARKATREQEAGSLLKNANSEEWAVWAEDNGYALLKEWQARRDPSKIRKWLDASTQQPSAQDNAPPACADDQKLGFSAIKANYSGTLKSVNWRKAFEYRHKNGLNDCLISPGKSGDRTCWRSKLEKWLIQAGYYRTDAFTVAAEVHPQPSLSRKVSFYEKTDKPNEILDRLGKRRKN